jgi:hypothetical protein
MPAILDKAQPRYRIIKRCPTCATVRVRVKAVRPSLLDLRLQGDVWIVDCAPEIAGVFVDSCRLMDVSAVALDLPSFNSQLYALRHRQTR